MARRKVGATVAEPAVEVREVRPAAQPFFQKNQNLILYAVGAIGLALLGWWGYKSLIVTPKQQEALESMWQAEAQFKRDSFKMALENPGGGYDGFLALADKYSGTPAGNLAKYYAGICYLQTGDMDNAIVYLEDYNPEGDLLPAMKYGALGDAYSEKKEFDKALSNYEKAVDATENGMLASIYLKKLGMLYEYQGNKADAKKAYERLKRDYPNPANTDWREIDKYIYRTGEGK